MASEVKSQESLQWKLCAKASERATRPSRDSTERVRCGASGVATGSGSKEAASESDHSIFDR